MPLIKLDNATLRYGMQPLLDHVDLQIDPQERVCLVGRNGEGKSTLLKILQGDVALESGQVWRQPALRMAYLPQDVPVVEGDPTVYEVVAGGLAAVGALLSEYHAAAVAVAKHPSDQAVQRLAQLQHDLEAQDGWQIQQQVETVLSRLELDADAKMASLSGGYKRRVLFARALVNDPELLLLDEPTNHLDLTTIEWLEEFLLGFRGALLFITHDRAFLRRLASRIIELDRGQLTSWPGNYDDYLAKREQRLADEAKHNAEFDKKLAAEEVWIRQGIKARRTRNEGRVRALKALREQRRQRREVGGTATMRLDSGSESGKVVVEATDISKSFGGKPVFSGFSTTIMRGDRLGIIGPNGAGKSTLLKVLLGELAPDSGKIKFGTRLQTAYFDQQRAQLDPERTVVDNITDRADTIEVGGKSRHVLSHLQDFLFSPDRARAKVKTLSGGERSRLLLARLFMKPANVLVLDEPTNDLDVETLELLEDLLGDYDGTVLLVSHDRAFLDNVVTSTIVFEGNGKIAEYVGGYSDWLRQRPKISAASKPASQPVAVATTPSPQKPAAAAKKKLSYKEQRELEQLPGLIERLEQEQAGLQRQVNSPEFYRGDQKEVKTTLARLEDIAGELERAYGRWAELE